TVPGSEITNPGEDTKVTYTANPQTITIKYVDDDNKGAQVGTDQSVPGKTGETVTPTYTIPEGYDYVSGKVDSHTMTADDNTVITVHLKHHHTTADKKITKTITYKTDEGDSVAPDYTQSVTIHKDTDDVTGKPTYTVDGKTLENGQTTLGSQSLPSKDGYYAANVPEGATSDSTVSFDSDNVNVNVVYKKLGKIIPVDESGNPIPGADTPTYNNSDDPTKPGDTTTPTVPGYTASKTTVPSSDITNPGDNTPVTYTPNTQTIKVVVTDSTTGKTITVDVPTSFNGKSDEKVGTDVTDGVQNVVNTLKKLGYTITNQGETPTSFDHSQNESADSDNNPQVINITVGHNHTATDK
ncbi:mucin-binding protein, partial [Lactobacillus psittaci]